MMVLKGPQDGMDMRFLFCTECNNRWKLKKKMDSERAKRDRCSCEDGRSKKR